MVKRKKPKKQEWGINVTTNEGKGKRIFDWNIHSSKKEAQSYLEENRYRWKKGNPRVKKYNKKD